MQPASTKRTERRSKKRLPQPKKMIRIHTEVRRLADENQGETAKRTFLEPIKKRESLLSYIIQGDNRHRKRILQSWIYGNESSQTEPKMLQQLGACQSNLRRNMVQNKSKLVRISLADKQLIKCNIHNSMCLSQKKSNRLSEKDERHLHDSFAKKIKEIKRWKQQVSKEDPSQPRATISASSFTLRGNNHEENQDAFGLVEGIYIVCDGHGSNGRQISHFVAKMALNCLQKHFEGGTMTSDSIKGALKKVEVELQNSGIDISYSGCTLVSLICYENKVYCVSVGDSKAILCQGYSTIQLSISHKPDALNERSRIELAGGVIHPLQIGKDKYSGPMRIWAPGKNSWGPGLALSRAFGDNSARQVGLISDPDINVQNLTSLEEFLVLGSDGLFDVLTDQEISQFVRKWQKEEAVPQEHIAERLVREAEEKSGEDADDITCIIVFL